MSEISKDEYRAYFALIVSKYKCEDIILPNFLK